MLYFTNDVRMFDNIPTEYYDKASPFPLADRWFTSFGMYLTGKP
jgi:hypothetical protein